MCSNGYFVNGDMAIFDQKTPSILSGGFAIYMDLRVITEFHKRLR